VRYVVKPIHKPDRRVELQARVINEACRQTGFDRPGFATGQQPLEDADGRASTRLTGAGHAQRCAPDTVAGSHRYLEDKQCGPLSTHLECRLPSIGTVVGAREVGIRHRRVTAGSAVAPLHQQKGPFLRDAVFAAEKVCGTRHGLQVDCKHWIPRAEHLGHQRSDTPFDQLGPLLACDGGTGVGLVAMTTARCIGPVTTGTNPGYVSRRLGVLASHSAWAVVDGVRGAGQRMNRHAQ
jgi:hypothetical protein